MTNLPRLKKLIEHFYLRLTIVNWLTSWLIASMFLIESTLNKTLLYYGPLLES